MRFVWFGVCEEGSDGGFDKLGAAGVALFFEDCVDFGYEVFLGVLLLCSLSIMSLLTHTCRKKYLAFANTNYSNVPCNLAPFYIVKLKSM